MRKRPPRILTQQRLLYCVLVNQLATPGLGTLWARRFFAGTGQLLLALTGFSLSMIWMIQFFHDLILKELGEPVPARASHWMGNWGFGLFGAAWCWALVTSIGLYRQAKGMNPAAPANLPPRRSDARGKESGPNP